jgi:hypothetical protein
MKKILMFGLLALSLGFTSCDNDDDDTPPATATPQPSAKTLLITAKPWKLTGVTVNGADFFAAFVPACQQDDLYKFALDGKLSIEDGTTACNPSTAAQGTWAFKENETVLGITSSTLVSGDFQIQELTATKTVLKRTDQSSGAVYMATFTAQ